MIEKYGLDQLTDILSCYDMQIEAMKSAMIARDSMLTLLHRKMSMHLLDSYFEMIEGMIIDE